MAILKGPSLRMAAACVCAIMTSMQADRAVGSGSGFGPSGPFDAAPFGVVERGEDGKTYGVRWAEPRKIRTVVVSFAEKVPAPDTLRVEYWHRTWNGKPDPVSAERGAGGAGWDRIDDWTNGEWKKADTRAESAGRSITFAFAPTGETEFKDLGHPGVTYRRTLKIRVVGDVPLPKIASLQALTDSEWRRVDVRIHFGKPAEPAITLSRADECRLEVFNGQLFSVGSVSDANRVQIDSRWRWNVPADPEIGVEAHLAMAVDPADSRYDRTIVTVRCKDRPFSFAADEVARGDRIFVDDLGVLVVRADDDITLEGMRKARVEFAGRTIYDRVADEPEQSLSRAWNDMPLKRPLHFVHGLPGDRNAMYQMPDGTIRITGRGRWFVKPFVSPRDAERKLWDVETYEVHFGFPPEHLRGGRELKDGYLPQLRTWWQDGPVYYEQTTILDKLDGDLSTVRLDDPTVLLMRLRVVNTSASQEGTAHIRLHTHRANGEKLYRDGDRVLADYKGQPRLRVLLRNPDRGTFTNLPGGVGWKLPLKPGESHDLYLAIPSITLEESEYAPLRTRDFDAASKRLCDYWKAIADRGAQVHTPEPWLNDFYRAQALHLMINCQKELNSEYLHAHVGTFYYGVYPNESAMMITDLDRRGYHDEARRNLDGLLHYQGSVKFLGNYKTQEGLFYGAGGHETGDYNKSHGYTMWMMAEHWRYTHDRAWMEKAAPGLVAACDWVTRERQATMMTSADGTKPIEYGFLPTGSLEDVTDYWYWLATNAATAWGFLALADALKDYGHPEADRLVRDAAAYRDDVLAGWNESRVRSPVVRLRDGTYVPHFPSRLYERGRAHGWIRETLEGAIFLLYYKLIPPESPQAKWVLKDYEDNLYVSEEYGYSIPNFDAFWFSRGGFSMQAQLLDGPPPYLYRDDIKHFLRAYFNGFASAFYPDIRMCNEHSLPELGYPAGDHFKTSDESQSTFWLRLMFVYEDGEDLHLGRAIPREWLRRGQPVGIERGASHFGPLTFSIQSSNGGSQIQATLDPPTLHPPRTIYLRFRHPDAKPIQSVTLNGQPHDRFDAKKEWVILPGTVKGKQEIVAKY